MRWLLLAASLCFSVGVAELGTRWLLVRSEDFAPTLASQRWMERYWKPVNRFGVRDAEWDPQVLARTRNLFVVGDSFAAGQGVRNVRDRVSGVLARELGPDWSVLTVAQPGWQTGDELEALERVPFRPSAVVLLYFVNDVLGAAARFGLELDLREELAIRPAWLRPLVTRSSLADLVYWRVWRWRHRALGPAYQRLLELGFFRHDVWRAHSEELRRMVAWVRERDAAFVAVVIPILVDVEGSQKYTGRVVRLFESEGVPVIDLAATLRGRDPDELIVSRENHHANERLHAEMAQLIYAELRRQGTLR